MCCVVVLCDVVYCGMVYVLYCVMCCVVVLCDVLCCGIVWCAVLWYGVIWCVVLRCGVLWLCVICSFFCCVVVWCERGCGTHVRFFLCERPRAKKITCRVRIPNTTSKLLFYGGRSLASFSIFTSNLENKTVDFNEIWTRIVVVRGKLDNHLNWCSCNFLLVCGKRPWRRVRLYL